MKNQEQVPYYGIIGVSRIIYGTLVSLKLKKKPAASPCDVPGIETKATIQDILDAISASRSR